MTLRWAVMRRVRAGVRVGANAGTRTMTYTRPTLAAPLLPPQIRKPLGPAKPQASVTASLSPVNTDEPADTTAIIHNATIRKSIPPTWPGQDAWNSLLTRRNDELARVDAARVEYKRLRKESDHARKSGGDDVDLQQINANARKMADDIREMERSADEIFDRIQQCRLAFPNFTHPDTPVGPEEKAIVRNVYAGVDYQTVLPEREHAAMEASQREDETMTLERWEGMVKQGKTSKSPAPDHLTLASQLTQQPTIDLDAGRQAVGPSWPFILGPLAMLEQALLRHATSLAISHGFHLVSPPVVIKTDLAERCGFMPRQGRGGQTYFVESSSVWADRGEVAASTEPTLPAHCLVGTAEISLGALLSNRTFQGSTDSQLPLRLLAITPSFRAEDGGRGSETKGLYRVHQFQKAEMFVVSPPCLSTSNAILKDLLSIQRTFLQSLNLTHRILDMPSEELGASAYRKYDIEAYMPGRGGWGEVSSASNCTDFQAARLHIREKASRVQEDGSGKVTSSIPVHTLNATLCAAPRVIVALLEQYGVSEGKLRLPRVLERYWFGLGDVEWVDAREVQSEQGGNVAAHQSVSTSRGFHTSSRQGAPSTSRKYHTSSRQTQSTSRKQPTTPCSFHTTSSYRTPKSSLLAQLQSRLATLSKNTRTDLASLTASFFILHELTALLPLILLFYLFTILGVGEQLCGWFTNAAADDALWRRKIGQWLNEGIKRVEKLAVKRGLWESERVEGTDTAAITGKMANAVAAYVVVKALLAPRLLASFYLSPLFARVVFEPVKRRLGRLVGKN